MRRDFALTATVAGEPLEFIARDLPAGVFFAGFQDTFPGAECFGSLSISEVRENISAHEAWMDQLLCRAMVEPVLTLETLRRLGGARDDLAVGYLWAINWDVPTTRVREHLVPPSPVAVPPERPGLLIEDYALVHAMPSPNVKLALRTLAQKTRQTAYHIWADWTISEFRLEWHVVLADDLKKRGARAAASLPQSDIVDAVGREAS